ncbi:AbrB/MazE/SpoVT family DNA-binding domain-containing protein [Methylophaga sp.]
MGIAMTLVTVSAKYQIVIPKEIRESMGIVSGQRKFQWQELDGLSRPR